MKICGRDELNTPNLITKMNLVLSLICLKTESPFTLQPYIGLENGSDPECPNFHQSHHFYTLSI